MNNLKDHNAIPGSFRDPEGFVFKNQAGEIFRQINSVGLSNFDLFNESNLKKNLLSKKWIVDFELVESAFIENENSKVIKPEKIPFISYPYEWCFDFYKDAALLTLEILKESLRSGFILKDSSAFNIQMYRGNPIFIDTLSFAKYNENEGWVGYRQFCQHFLAPILLSYYRSHKLNGLFLNNLDGIPLELASSLLPMKSYFSLVPLIHIHLHSRFSAKLSSKPKNNEKTTHKLSSQKVIQMVQQMEDYLRGLDIKNQSFWNNYYTDELIYTESGFKHKKEIIDQILREKRNSIVWDLGSNTGVFSLIAAEYASLVLSFDYDYQSVNSFYRIVQEKKIENVIPLVLDLNHPTPSVGWSLQERDSLSARGGVKIVMALALIHHICVGNNVPIEYFLDYMKQLGREVIIEFVPKEDPQTQRLLEHRQDVFENYNQIHFEKEFVKRFHLISKTNIKDSGRVIYYGGSK